MGYTTYFNGEMEITPELDPDQVAYLQAFNRSRRMKRDAAKAELLPDPLRLAVGLPIGLFGSYYVGSHDVDHGQIADTSIINYNLAPGQEERGYVYRDIKTGEVCAAPTVRLANGYEQHRDGWQGPLLPGHNCTETYELIASADPDGQPGLWCQWTVSDGGGRLFWDEGEKFYNYEEWMAYIYRHFLGPWGRTLAGEIYWEGEEGADQGKIDAYLGATGNQIIRVHYAVIGYDDGHKLNLELVRT